MKNILFLVVISAIIVFAVSCGRKADDEANATFRTLTMEEGISAYHQLMQNTDIPEYEKPVLLDVRHDNEYAAGHIPGAVLLTMETIAADNAAQAIKSKSQPAFVYCRSGVRSKMAAARLAGLGYSNITNIGGIMAYSGDLEK